MTVLSQYHSDDFRREYFVKCNSLASKADLAAALRDYREALDLIDRDLGADKTWTYNIAVIARKAILANIVPDQLRSTAFQALRLLAKEAEEQDGHNPWQTLCAEFWLAALKHKELELEVRDIVGRIERIFKRVNDGGVTVTGLWETEQVQFGEPLVTLLALHDRRFVPDYTRLLAQWDMDHEVLQFEVIKLIVNKYGVCPETEDLLYCRAIRNPGQNGYDQIEDLFPVLQRAYGDFTQSLLFGRIVEAAYIADLDYRKEVFSEFVKRKVRDPEARSPNLDQAHMFTYSDNDVLKQGFERVWERLKAINPPPDFRAV